MWPIQRSETAGMTSTTANTGSKPRRIHGVIAVLVFALCVALVRYLLWPAMSYQCWQLVDRFMDNEEPGDIVALAFSFLASLMLFFVVLFALAASLRRLPGLLDFLVVRTLASRRGSQLSAYKVNMALGVIVAAVLLAVEYNTTILLMAAAYVAVAYFLILRSSRDKSASPSPFDTQIRGAYVQSWRRELDAPLHASHCPTCGAQLGVVHCSKHAQSLATDRCAGCGGAFCSECLQQMDGALCCDACRMRLISDVIQSPCANHPDVPAIASCPECERLFCNSCLTTLRGCKYCTACRARIRKASLRWTICLQIAIAVFLFAPSLGRMASVAVRDISDLLTLIVSGLLVNSPMAIWALTNGWHSPEWETPSTGSLIKDVWYGLRPLPEIFWVWGGPVFIVVQCLNVIGLYYLFQHPIHLRMPYCICLVFYSLYQFFLLMGIFRSAEKGYGFWGIIARILMVLTMASTGISMGLVWSYTTYEDFLKW